MGTQHGLYALRFRRIQAQIALQPLAAAAKIQALKGGARAFAGT